MKGWLNDLKSMETMDEPLTTCNLKVMSGCLSVPDATSLYHCLKNKLLKLIWFQWYGSKYLVLCTIEEGVGNTCMTDHAPMKLEKYYACWIEGDWLATGQLVSNA